MPEQDSLAERALDELEELARFIDTVRLGVAVIVSPGDVPAPDRGVQFLRDQADMEQFVARQKELGFPYLFGLATVRLWSILEALVDDQLRLLLKKTSPANLPESVRKLKGVLSRCLNRHCCGVRRR